jgi:hypothetical protein
MELMLVGINKLIERHEPHAEFCGTIKNITMSFCMHVCRIYPSYKLQKQSQILENIKKGWTLLTGMYLRPERGPDFLSHSLLLQSISLRIFLSLLVLQVLQ